MEEEAYLGDHEKVPRIRRPRMRKLAVMFTDMAGSTDYAEKHGGFAAYEKRRTHNNLLLPLVESHSGTLVRIIGDALLTIFPDAPDAARCAIAMQCRLAEFNASEDLDVDDQEIHIRIGIHYGKAVVFRERGGVELAGRAVNLAARVEAGGGKQTDQILLSEAAVAQLHLHHAGEFTTRPLGMVEAKGVGPLLLHRLLWKADELTSAKPPVRPNIETPNIETAASFSQRIEEEENRRAVHGLTLDTHSGCGYVLPVQVRLLAGEPVGIRPRGRCDSRMLAAAQDAMHAASEVLVSLGFDDDRLEHQAIEWWIDAADLHYEPASLEVALALAVVAAHTGVDVDPGVAVTGALRGQQVVAVAGVAGKWEKLRTSAGFHTLVLPSDALEELPADVGDATLRLIDVPTLEAAVRDVLGPALGLAAQRLEAMPKPAAGGSVDLQLWVQRDERRELTRDVGIAPDEDSHTWNIGDRIRVCVQVSRDCHIAVINVGPTGNVTVLIPNTHYPDTAASARQILAFPRPSDQFHFHLLGPPGRERLFALASGKPLKLRPEDFDQSGHLVCAKPTTRDIGIAAEDLSTDLLARCEIEFYVSDQREHSRKGVARELGSRAEVTDFRIVELG